MSILNDYKAYFKPAKVPGPLVKLIEFEKTQDGWFSQSLQMDGSYFDGVGLRTYSTDAAFINSFREFAQADGTGSTYAIWSQTGDWENAPIVAFGSEGGFHIVAENEIELIRVLTFDREARISFDKVFYYKPNDSQPSAGASDYAKWLKKTFKLDPVAVGKEVEQIVKRAQKAHKKEFDAWMKRYYEA